MISSPSIEAVLLKFASTGLIIPKKENNIYLKVSYKGTGTTISEKWNVKIYTSGKIVTTDQKILEDIISNNFKTPDKSLKIVQIDDAGFGFPLCGVMIGVYAGTYVITDTVSAQLFQGDAYTKRAYLRDYTEKGLRILYDLKITPATHRIEICSGFINQSLKGTLRDLGFDVIITEIKGPLQDQLEDLYKQHVKDVTGQDLAYDPKGMTKKEIAEKYYAAVKWGKKNAPHLLKSGWKSLQK